MTALDEAVCTLAKLHPRMWACSSCGWRSEQAIAADNVQAIRRDIAEHPACPLCRRIDGHEPTCLENLALLDEGRQQADARPATPDPHEN